MYKSHYNVLLGANEAIEGHDITAVATELSLKVNNVNKLLTICNEIVFNSNGCVEE